MTRNKKSKYKHVKIGSKKYYFYRIEWVDITGDAGHASPKKFVWSFASYEDKDVSFSDRNIFPVGCVVKMEKITL
jgi:hypothetical protein